MKIQTRTEKGVTFLDLNGKLMIGAGDVVLREAIQKALDSGARKLVINLQGVKMMDSSGLGELVRSKATAARAGASIKLLHVEEKIQEILEMTRLIGVFDTFDEEVDAITSFG